MEFSLQKELPGRLRVKLAGPVPAADLDALERVVLASAAVLRVTVYPRIGSLAVVYRPGEGNRRQVLAHLESIGVVPDMAVGDFDSLGYVPKCRRVSRHPVKKDKTDMELAMEKALYWKQDDLYVYGGLSGRLDHTLANLQLFAKFSERGAYVTGIGEDFAVRALTGPDVYDLPALDEGIVSVIALNDRVEGVIETGLLYSMDDEPLTSRVSRGISNEFIGKPATIGVERGTVLVFHPLP